MTSPPNAHCDDDCTQPCDIDHMARHREAWADYLDELHRDHRMMEEFYRD